MSRTIVVAVPVVLVLALCAGLFLYLTRPFLALPEPATLECIDPARTHTEPLGAAGRIFGIGLSYAGHIAESPGLYDPDTAPVTFRKQSHTINRGDEVLHPGPPVLLAAAAALHPEHAALLERELTGLPALMDYEVEVGMVVTAPFAVEALDDPDFAPPLGFFVANDLTARIMIGMAPRFADSVDYLAAGKGLPGFLPVGDRVTIPDEGGPDAWPCVELVTKVNGELRQRAPSSDIVFGPRTLLRAAARAYDLEGYERGDWIITGTPAGVALQTPGWLQRAMRLLDPSATTKVAAMAARDEAGAFLHPGDVVTVSAGYLGEKTVTVR